MALGRGRVSPQQVVEDGDEDVGSVVEQSRRALSGLAEMGGENRSGEWHTAQTPRRSRRLRISKPLSQRLMWVNMRWWLIHMMPMKAKLMMKEMYEGHCRRELEGKRLGRAEGF